MKKLLLCIVVTMSFWACQTSDKKEARRPVFVKTHVIRPTKAELDSIPVIPVRHASFALELNSKMIYVDPIGNLKGYQGLPKPDIILITPNHTGRLSLSTLINTVGEQTQLITSKTLKFLLPRQLKKKTQVIKSGQELKIKGVHIKAIPFYGKNDRIGEPSVTGNGFVLYSGNKRVYVSGKTEHIMEMQGLQNIDVAFIRMILPQFSTVHKAIETVLDFKPKKVYPYCYEGVNAFSAVALFKGKVEAKDPAVEVQILNWYPVKK